MYLTCVLPPHGQQGVRVQPCVIGNACSTCSKCDFVGCQQPRLVACQKDVMLSCSWIYKQRDRQTDRLPIVAQWGNDADLLVAGGSAPGRRLFACTCIMLGRAWDTTGGQATTRLFLHMYCVMVSTYVTLQHLLTTRVHPTQGQHRPPRSASLRFPLLTFILHPQFL
jgi:hypothetical protein